MSRCAGNLAVRSRLSGLVDLSQQRGNNDTEDLDRGDVTHHASEYRCADGALPGKATEEYESYALRRGGRGVRWIAVQPAVLPQFLRRRSVSVLGQVHLPYGCVILQR